MGEQFEIVIVGGGPAGLAAGVSAAARGISHVVLERANLADTIHRYQKGKHVMAEPERLRLHDALDMAFEAGTREEVLARWSEDAEEAGVNLRIGTEYEVDRIEGELGSFTLTLRSSAQIRCSHVVLAIGVQGNLRTFGVPGDGLPHVSYQLDDPAEHVDKQIVVVGAGDAGIENALALLESGNDVSIVNRRDEFNRAKARNRSLIEAAIKSGAIQYFPNTVVDHFSERSVTLATSDGEVEVPAELVIGRLGAIPPRKFLQDIGIEFPSEDLASVPRVSDHYGSNIPGIHLVGAIVGYPLIKNCMNQGFEVVEYLLGHDVTPADEALLVEKFADVHGSVSEIVERIRSTVPLFEPLSAIQLREFLVESNFRSFRPNQKVYERNSYSTEFYAILEGEVEVMEPDSDADRETDRFEGEVNAHSILLGQGAFFGEGSLISGRRRSRAVRAIAPSVLIEIPRSAMNKLINTYQDVKDVLNLAFTERKLADLFPELGADKRREVARSSRERIFRSGEALWAEGDESDGLYLIRSGTLAVSKGLSEKVILNYVQAGSQIGEVGLVSADRRRSATVTATTMSELVLVPLKVIDTVIDENPDIRKRFEQEESEKRVGDSSLAVSGGASGVLEFFMQTGEGTAGGGEGTDMLVIDESLCIRCDNCEKACADTHQGVSRLDREAGPYFGDLHIPTACKHCQLPKCMNDCPPDALRRHENGEVYILDNCIGCGNCVSNCPYDVIKLAHVEEKASRNILFRLLFGTGRQSEGSEAGEKVAVKCDLCRKLPQPVTGRAKAACVASCPTGAMIRVNPRDFVDEIRSVDD